MSTTPPSDDPKDASGTTPAVPPKTDRIAKVLSRAGIASRREAERLIEAGRVSVNGKTILSPALNVTAKDRVVVDGKVVGAPEPARLWLYHKPTGLVTSEKDEKGRNTVFAALPEEMPRVMSVGRLDINSEGLLLLTNDGELKRKLELPLTGWVRKYRVRVKGVPRDEDFEVLRTGITIDGEKFQPMSVIVDRQKTANAWLTVGIREGRNREVRRAMEAVGLQVNRLIRISYGPFQLGDLKPGDVEEIRARVLRDQLGLEGAPEKKPVRSRKPGGRGPGPGKPGAGKPAYGKPGGKPGGGRGGDDRQGGRKPGAGKPGGTKPGAGKPAAGGPGGRKPPRR